MASKLPVRREVNTSTNLHNQNRMQGGTRWYGERGWMWGTLVWVESPMNRAKEQTEQRALMNRAKEQNRLLLLHKSLLSTYCVQSSSEGI